MNRITQFQENLEQRVKAFKADHPLWELWFSLITMILGMVSCFLTIGSYFWPMLFYPSFAMSILSARIAIAYCSQSAKRMLNRVYGRKRSWLYFMVGYGVMSGISLLTSRFICHEMGGRIYRQYPGGIIGAVALYGVPIFSLLSLFASLCLIMLALSDTTGLSFMESCKAVREEVHDMTRFDA